MSPLLLSIALARTTGSTEVPSLLVDRWTREDGLPVDQLTDVVVDGEGFVWATSFDGLVRFDGHQVRVYRRAEFPDLPSNRLVELELGPDGALWMLAESGELVRYDGTDFQVWSWPGQVPDLLSWVQGTLWATGGEGVIRIQGSGPEWIGMPERTEVLASIRGELWVSSRNYGIWRLESGQPIPGAEPMHHVRAMLEGPGGEVWLGGTNGLWRMEQGRAELVHVEEGVEICELFLHEGELRVHDTLGWWRLALPPMPGTRDNPGRCATRSSAPWFLDGGLLSKGQDRVFEDDSRISGTAPGSQGSIWIASEGGGLLRLKPRRVWPLALSFPATPWTVLVDKEDTLWTGTYDGNIWRVLADRIEPVLRQDERGAHSFVPSLLLGPDGRVWLPEPGGLCAWSLGGCKTIDLGALGPVTSHGFRGVHLDAEDQVWLGGHQHLWRRGADGRVSEILDARGQSVPSADAFADRNGVVWVGSLGGGVLRVEGQTRKRWTRAEGLSSDHIRAIWPDSSGGAWVGTQDAGLCYIPTEGPPVCLDKRHGVFDDAIHSLVFIEGRLWMSTNRGISFVLLRMLEAFVRGEVEDVQAIGLAEADGMLHREANGGAGAPVARDSQGRLWYPTQRGLAMIDPRDLPTPEAPRPSLEGLRIEGEPRPISERVHLAAHERTLEIQWTAPEFDHPEALHFRYRLRGADEGWSYTPARGARWTNLPPGELHLELQAGVGGIWSASTAHLVLHRQPTFYETAWFPLSAALGGLALSGLIFAARFQVRRRRERELEGLVSRRTSELAAANTELERQSARLAEVDRLRKRLIADLSHELRTPLTLVAGPLEDLRAAEPGLSETDRERLRLVRRNSQRLEELVEQLLDVARLEAGTIRLRVRRSELGALARRVSERFTAACARAGLELIVQTPQQPAELWCDPDLIDKVLSNLISNARKFTPSGGRIEVVVAAPGDPELPLRVEVRDTGIGVREDQVDRLFDRFVQGEQGDARRFEGVGIGLALARDLVALHGGGIGVDQREIPGSCFWFTLPRGVDHLAPEDLDLEAHPNDVPTYEVEQGSPPVGSAEGQPLILVVEDHADMRAFLMSHLGRYFEVEGAENGEQALRAIARRRPAAVVSDVMMPGMDGLELCRRLRAVPETAAIPVLLASAKAGEEDRVAGLEVADDYMTKPLRMREMVQRLRKLVGRPEAPGVPEASDAPEADASVHPEVDRQMCARLEALLAERLGDPDFGVEEMAKAMGYSRRQLLREVARVTGESPSDMLRARRMEAGRDLLTRGAVHTVAEAAAQVGLSPAYFSRTYSAWFGTSPSEALKPGR